MNPVLKILPGIVRTASKHDSAWSILISYMGNGAITCTIMKDDYKPKTVGKIKSDQAFPEYSEYIR